jgi:hypothetical protein
MVADGLCRSVVYEQCVARPERVFAGLFDELDLTPSTATRRAIGTWVSSPTSEKRHTDWRAALTREEGERVMEIVNAFGLDIQTPGERRVSARW